MTGVERAFVWLGGALFVVSLACCAYCYVAVWSRPPAGPGAAIWTAALANTALFGLFAGHHSLFARERVKAAVARVVPDRLLTSVFVWIASTLFIVACISWVRTGRDVYDLHGWIAAVFTAAQVSGVLLTAAGVRRLDPLELAGIRRRERSDGPAVQTTGPYGVVRHPLYLGWLLMTFGAAHMTVDRLAFAVISSGYLLIAIPWEEASLERDLGPDYAAYKKKVRWRVIPYVY